jgi:hypothetical protein
MVRTVVSVQTAYPIGFVTGTERPRLKKTNTVTTTIPSVLAGCKMEKPKPFAKKSAKTTNRLSEMLLALQWALFINVTVPVWFRIMDGSWMIDTPFGIPVTRVCDGMFPSPCLFAKRSACFAWVV